MIQELIPAYKEALVASDEDRLRALEAECPALILERPRLRALAWAEYQEAIEYREAHRYDENWKEIEADDRRRVWGDDR